MSSGRTRTAPTLTPRSTPPRPARAPAAPLRAPRRPRQRRFSLRRWLLNVVIAVLAYVLIVILILRWLPPPTSAFMLESPTQPVQYHWVDESRIATSMKRAVVASEDQKFYEHHGFDFSAIGRAVHHNLNTDRRRGASTISQQTAKNLFLWSGGGYLRKGLEAALTAVIELMWPKQRILEIYLNIAEFGPGIYGVDAAARHYFGVGAAGLSPEQSALLVAVLPSPRRWQVAPPSDYVRERQSWILEQMKHLPPPAD